MRECQRKLRRERITDLETREQLIRQELIQLLVDEEQDLRRAAAQSA